MLDARCRDKRGRLAKESWRDGLKGTRKMDEMMMMKLNEFN